ncbi:MAG: HNH endonuclease [Flavobacteriales bacterium]|nr:HNH endonuclease [Flavobacteriales bacterium]
MKLTNLASIDPEFRKTGRKGLEGASEFDRAMWAEYHANLNELAPESEALLAELMTGDADAPIEVQPDGTVLRVPEGPTEGTASVKVRRGQRYFRQAVLNAYQGRCVITGIAVRELLVASHIIPWNAAEEHRLDTQNGIALNALHDKAFDRGLITFDTELRLMCAPSLRDHFAHATVAQHFQAYEGKPLSIPAEAAGPSLNTWPGIGRNYSGSEHLVLGSGASFRERRVGERQAACGVSAAELPSFSERRVDKRQAAWGDSAAELASFARPRALGL